MNGEREEKLITTAAWMYEVRRAARTIYGKNYTSKIEPAKELLSAYAEHHGISCIAAVYGLLGFHQRILWLSVFVQLLGVRRFAQGHQAGEGMTANEFAKSDKHLPLFLRDFHDQKDVFKCIGGMNGVGYKKEEQLVSWVDGHCYVIDKFLHFMAQHGYTLQRSRQNIQFYELAETIKKRRDEDAMAFNEMLGSIGK